VILAFAHLHGPGAAIAARFGLLDTLGRDHVHGTVADAVRAEQDR
jgi:hypothetical protein